MSVGNSESSLDLNPPGTCPRDVVAAGVSQPALKRIHTLLQAGSASYRCRVGLGCRHPRCIAVGAQSDRFHRQSSAGSDRHATDVSDSAATANKRSILLNPLGVQRRSTDPRASTSRADSRPIAGPNPRKAFPFPMGDRRHRCRFPSSGPRNGKPFSRGASWLLLAGILVDGLRRPIPQRRQSMKSH